MQLHLIGGEIGPEAIRDLLAPQPVARRERQEFDQVLGLLQPPGTLLDRALAAGRICGKLYQGEPAPPLEERLVRQRENITSCPLWPATKF